jgi:DNA repair protein RecO (recombination protein O)
VNDIAAKTRTRGRSSGSAFATRALLLRAVPFGERDIIATFFTEEAGVVAAMVRNGRASGKQAGGAVEPFHELQVTFVDAGRDGSGSGREFIKFREGTFGRLRSGLVADLNAMEAAGRLLRLVRALAPERTPEPRVWAVLGEALDALDGGPVESGPPGLAPTEANHTQILGEIASVRLLAVLGYALRCEACVRCDTPRPAGRGAYFSVEAGGVVCTSCGGAGIGVPISSALLALVDAAQGEIPLGRLATLDGAAEAAGPLARLVDASVARAKPSSTERSNEHARR